MTAAVTEERWAWLDRIEGDVRQLLAEVGVEKRTVDRVLDDPCGWGFDDQNDNARDTYSIAALVVACVYGDMMFAVEDVVCSPSLHKPLLRAADLWLEDVTRRLEEASKGARR